jgi:hypothetical protein
VITVKKKTSKLCWSHIGSNAFVLGCVGMLVAAGLLENFSHHADLALTLKQSAFVFGIFGLFAWIHHRLSCDPADQGQ